MKGEIVVKNLQSSYKFINPNDQFVVLQLEHDSKTATITGPGGREHFLFRNTSPEMMRKIGELIRFAGEFAKGRFIAIAQEEGEDVRSAS